MSRFLATNNKGFRMTFENGFEISVQWGPGNYCEKRDADFGLSEKSKFWESCSAEIAIFYKDDSMVSLGQDTVEGWVSADQVAKVIAIVQSAKTKNEIKEKYKALNI